MAPMRLVLNIDTDRERKLQRRVVREGGTLRDLAEKLLAQQIDEDEAATETPETAAA